MAAATPEIAIVARLKAGATAVGSRVYSQVNTQEPVLPLIVVTRQGAVGSARLSGTSCPLKQYTVEVDCYSPSQVGADAIAKQVRDLLAPDGTPWVDPANGVQGCFFADSTASVLSDESKDTPRLVRETYTVWHTPT